ncbi:YheV family putative zinc ribbon protein [Aliikangiella maris]|uniref:YheV family putative zinc ribbon protein n=2 Tax=Aliikangiella maris TaxID=3162458 RepID=A0ABV3MR58_9GAMM
MQPNQRFIAGATCPNCNEMDSLLVNIDDESIECVDCGFAQTAQQRDEDAKKKAEMPPPKTAPKKVNVSDIIRISEIKQ